LRSKSTWWTPIDPRSRGETVGPLEIVLPATLDPIVNQSESTSRTSIGRGRGAGHTIVLVVGALPRKSSDHFTLHVDQYSTVEEARALAAVLFEKRPGVIKELRKLNKGYVKSATGLATRWE
jgi:hypothetical protein